MRFHHRAVPIVLTAIVVDMIGFGIIMPVLPTLITEVGHVAIAEATRIAGWLLAAFAVAQFFAGPILGNLGDRFGRRPVLIASMAAFAVDYALTATAPTLAWLFVGRIIAGIAGATYGPAAAVFLSFAFVWQEWLVYDLLGVRALVILPRITVEGRSHTDRVMRRTVLHLTEFFLLPGTAKVTTTFRIASGARFPTALGATTFKVRDKYEQAVRSAASLPLLSFSRQYKTLPSAPIAI